EASYGSVHPRVATHLNNLAELLRATNRLAEAEPLMRRAVEIFVASLGPDHPNTQTVFGNHLAILAALKGVDVETLIKEMLGDGDGHGISGPQAPITLTLSPAEEVNTSVHLMATTRQKRWSLGRLF